MYKKFLLLSLVFFSFSGCVTSVFFDSNEKGAEVYLDREKMGVTPFTAKISAYAWYDPKVTVKKEGFKDLNTRLKLTPRVGNIVAGILFFPTIVISLPCGLTCYGADKEQYFELEKE